MTLPPELSSLYPEYKILGPYLRKSDNRMFVVLLANSGKRTTKLLSRLLMEVKLNRILPLDETVDHIDGDKTNDSIDNLRVVSRSQNSSLAAKRLQIPEKMSCVYCQTEFSPSKYNVKPNKQSAGPFCSRTCSGKYGKEVQNGAKRLDIKEDNRLYFTTQNTSLGGGIGNTHLS